MGFIFIIKTNIMTERKRDFSPDGCIVFVHPRYRIEVKQRNKWNNYCKIDSLCSSKSYFVNNWTMDAPPHERPLAQRNHLNWKYDDHETLCQGYGLSGTFLIAIFPKLLWRNFHVFINNMRRFVLTPSRMERCREVPS